MTDNTPSINKHQQAWGEVRGETKIIIETAGKYLCQSIIQLASVKDPRRDMKTGVIQFALCILQCHQG